MRSALNWFKTILLRTFEATASRDNGLLLAAFSWSPSLRIGIISASFQLSGNLLVRIEQLMMSVRGPNMTWRQSFSTRALILSGPEDLFIGRDVTIRQTSSSDTVLKLNNSIEEVSMPVSEEKSRTMMLCSSLKCHAASAAFKPTLAKN